MSRHKPLAASMPDVLVDPPCRHGRIRKRYVVLILVLLLIGWMGWKVVQAVSAKPGALVDYGQKLLDMSASMQPEGENGWPVMAETLVRFGEIGFPELPDWPTDRTRVEDVRSLYRVMEGSYDVERLRFELAYLNHIEDSGVLELLDQFAASPRCVREAFEGDEGHGLLFVLLPELGAARQVAKARVAAMRVAAGRGDDAELLRAWRHTVSLARAMSHDPTFISHLVGLAILNLGCQEMNRLTMEYELDEATCRQLLAVLDQQPILVPMSAVLERERQAQYDTIQHTHSDDGSGDGILLVSKLQDLSSMSGQGGLTVSGQHPIYNIAGLVLPSRAETTRTLDEYFDAAKEQADMPRSIRQNHPVDLNAYIETLPRFQMLLRMTLPAIGRAVFIHDQSVSVLESTRLLLALEAYQSRHGRLPSVLDDLVPEFMAELPQCAVSCQPFVFLERAPSEADPRLFWLYSVGEDGVDHGGTEPPSTKPRVNALRGGTDATGFDYTFNRLRDPYSEEESAPTQNGSNVDEAEGNGAEPPIESESGTIEDGQ